MNINSKKAHINYLKENCSDFIKEIHEYMLEKNWTWHDSGNVPTEEKIKEMFFNLLDLILKHDSTEVKSGGFYIFINEDKFVIECYFDFCSEDNIRLVSFDGKNPVINYINILCSEYPVLNKNFLMKVYKNWCNN